MINFDKPYKQISIEVLSTDGRRIGSAELKEARNIEIPISGVSGIYYLHLNLDGIPVTLPILKR